MDAKLKTILDKRKVNAREDMPECSKLIDAHREIFGRPVGIVAHENGKSLAWGKPLEGDEFECRVWPYGRKAA